jgi:hypothetical protein
MREHCLFKIRGVKMVRAKDRDEVGMRGEE